MTDMYYHGLDVVEIPRIRKALSRWGTRFLERVYTAAEIELCQNRVPELASRFAAKEAVAKAIRDNAGIVWREVEVLRLVAQGRDNQEIADMLFISETTVRTHVSNILGKLHLANRTQAALYAVREGLAGLDTR